MMPIKARMLFILLCNIGLLASAQQTPIKTIQERVDGMNLPFSFEIGNSEAKVIQSYAYSHRTRTIHNLSQIRFFGPVLDSVFQRENVPKIFKYLAPANSELELGKIGEKGNQGYWPLTYRQATTYGLEVNDYIDDRRDLVISAKAAANYLYDLQKVYNDWRLAVIAFRVGPIELNRYFHAQNKPVEFDSIQAEMPSAFREPLSRLVAYLYLSRYGEEHKLQIENYDSDGKADTIRVSESISLRQLAFDIGMELPDLQKFNPRYKAGFLPDVEEEHVFTLHPHYAEKYRVHRKRQQVARKVKLLKVERDSIIAIWQADSINRDTALLLRSLDSLGIKGNSATTNNTVLQPVLYEVGKGEGLLEIADLFDCKESDIIAWNKLAESSVREGQNILINVSTKKFAYYNRMSSLTAAQKLKMMQKD